ncbi:MAG TPA: methylated-DNA--[protein]-cysteine S-methyltransferase [Candidatus Babeliales bacterium]|nr:methylated-DNA--[protein]-cysteine S-methyltransferase [Candidatus Babeliales bacterium]
MKLQIQILKNKTNYEINYGFYKTEFGICLVGLIDQYICHLSFHDNEEQGLLELQKEWPQVKLISDQEKIPKIIKAIFKKSGETFSLALQGTPFQIEVWKQLIKIPAGSIVSYQEVAHALGKATATRAVASAIAKNNISYLIPCHRVIRKSGKINNYRWGMERKKKLLEFDKYN